MLFTFFLILFSSVVFYTSTLAFTPGDANNDGDVNLADIIHVVNIVFGEALYPPEGEQADPNADCTINIVDIVYMVNYIFKGGTPPDWITCFENPVPVGEPIETPAFEESFFITFDGKRAYFSSNGHPNYGGTDLFYSDWDSVSRTWSIPVNLGSHINSGSNDIEPSVSSDGKKLFFQAFGRAGGLGGWEVWYCEWDSVAEQWEVPINPGPNINSGQGEGYPFITADGQELYFAGPGGLYVSYWTGSEWGPRAFLDYPSINYWGVEAGPSLTADKKWFYFDGYPTMLVSYWTGIGWTPRKELLAPINPVAYRPHITPDGKKLYFISGRPCELGACHIWVAERKFQNK